MSTNNTPLVKPYPCPNPHIPGSTSAFSRFDKEGDHYLAILEPDCPVVEFKRIDDQGKWGFVRVQDKSGKVLTKKHSRLAPYIPGDNLRELVRLAQILQRPVLLKGEPGSGKTQLARSVAFEWYRENYREHYFEWHVKSTTKAAEGLYTYDHIKRLRDANDSNLNIDVLDDKDRYRTFGPLAKAFLSSTREAPAILLIDEIDKADIDFPNDLLLELDEQRFRIPETEEEFEAGYPPVVFITSNDERELPEAFLRRCLFMFIKFPADDQLKAIIRAHLPDLMEKQEAFLMAATDAAIETILKDDEEYNKNKADPQYVARKKQELFNFVDFAIRRFNQLRQAIETDPADNKRVSTSELLDWLRAYQFDLLNWLETGKNDGIPEKITQWMMQYQKDQEAGVSAELVQTGLLQLPFYHQALLKTYAASNRENKINPAT